MEKKKIISALIEMLNTKTRSPKVRTVVVASADGGRSLGEQTTIDWLVDGFVENFGIFSGFGHI